MIERLRAALAQGLNWIALRRRALLGGVLLLGTLLTALWFMRLATAPARRAGEAVDLAGFGLPGVELRIIHPVRLSASEGARELPIITVSARADTPEAIQRFEVAFPLSEQAILFVDSDGDPIPGRLTITPGYPDALPHNLRVVHGQTQLQGRLVVPYRLKVVPTLRQGERATPISQLAFEIRLESRWEHAFRLFAATVFSMGLPYLILGVVLLAAALGWQRYQTRRRRRREIELSAAYLRLREQIKLERWADARDEIETIREVEPQYRDVDRLDALVSSAETATWRREQLYATGIRSYRERDWPRAVQAFSAIENETPYYRDIRFLRRTAALYADLSSRDRSLRMAAARELGDVADLVDMQPLVDALGDPSEEVAQVAEASFSRIGLGGFDALLSALVHESPQVCERAYRLIESFGQDGRERLLEALRSSSPQLTTRVAQLLITLGARRELAEALLWIDGAHQEGLVAALLSEGPAATGVLLEALMQAAPEREQLLINALAALKLQEDIDRRIAEALRSTRDARLRAVLERALSAEPSSFGVSAGSTLGSHVDDRARAEPERLPARRLRLLDRRE
ncbi:MAG: hypothetical protein JXA74_02740 [Anaerolineae bacterium]|nr:hypothetical protein [Anaerolineae bacterium]